ncbi:hypothetical protein EYC80_006081 [Monilinia laxa]|nr:hypothetical protein EYC80_006081 [Monilinia laxa]
MANEVLKTPGTATRDTTLMASLLLDFLEKIINSEPRSSKSWTIHTEGALTMVKLRGLDEFIDRSQICMLMRLSTHYTVSCIASGSPLLETLITLHNFLGNQLGTQDTGFQLADLIMFGYASLCSKTREDTLSFDEIIEWSIALDRKLKRFYFRLPTRWQHSVFYSDCKTDRAFDPYYDLYPDANTCQELNMHRIIRILLNNFFMDHCPTSLAINQYMALMDSIRTSVHEICASVPQYLDCKNAARQRLPVSDFDQSSTHRHHTPDHDLDCCTLIFPLYVVGQSNIISGARSWVIEQLSYMSDHFRIKKAKTIADILEREPTLDPRLRRCSLFLAATPLYLKRVLFSVVTRMFI